MVQFKQSVLLAFTLMASSPIDVLSFSQSSISGGRSTTSFSRPTQALQATSKNNDDNVKKVVGGASAFVTGLVIATQVAFADTSTLAQNPIASPLEGE